LPWSLELIERFADRLDFQWLSSNAGVPWSIEFIERFEEQWDLGRISMKPNSLLPLLLPKDVVEVMAHHLAELESINCRKRKSENETSEPDRDVHGGRFDDDDSIPF